MLERNLANLSLAYRSESHMIGYLNHPEENARFFGGGDGFLRSGDLGHYDDKGNLYFDGRIKARVVGAYLRLADKSPENL